MKSEQGQHLKEWVEKNRHKRATVPGVFIYPSTVDAIEAAKERIKEEREPENGI